MAVTNLTTSYASLCLCFASTEWREVIRAFQNALTEGTRVVTGGGIYGTVKRVDLASNIIEVEIAKGTVISVDKNYVFADVASQMQSQAK